MPYKDPKSQEAKASQHARYRRWYEKNREIERSKSRDVYWENPEKERERNRVFRNKLAIERRCVYCGKERDRENKQLCSTCAPIHAIKARATHEKAKLAAFDAYGGRRCACCGESNIVMLNIHHINGDGAEHRRELRGGKGDSGGGGIKVYFWLKRNNYPPGFGVLCFNCNHAIHVLGYCPHVNAPGIAVSP